MAKKTNTGLIVLLVVAGVLLLSFLWGVGVYNSFVQKDVAVEAAWGNVQSAYQRRADLIPNLVETVKGAANFEQETQTQIAELRNQATTAQTKMKSATNVAELESADTEMTGVLSRLMVVVEAYPELKANQNFLALQDELAGTENRIKWERDNFNKEVQTYKTATRIFPSSIIAGMTGFASDKYNMFEAAPGAETAPTVDFGN